MKEKNKYFSVKRLTNLKQDDKRLVEFVKTRLIISPPEEQRAKNVSINIDPSKGQAKRVANLLNNRVSAFSQSTKYSVLEKPFQ